MKPVDNLYELARILDGVPVLGIIPNSPSAKAGLRYGDILMECNGNRTRNLDDYLDARKLDRERMLLKIFRGGSELDLELRLGRAPIEPQRVLEFVQHNDGLDYIVPTSRGASDSGSSCN